MQTSKQEAGSILPKGSPYVKTDLRVKFCRYLHVCMFALVIVRKEARQSNLAVYLCVFMYDRVRMCVTTAVDFILCHLTLPGGEAIPGI